MQYAIKFRNEFIMQFSFGKHDNLNDINYYLLSLHLENRILYPIYQRYF